MIEITPYTTISQLLISLIFIGLIYLAVRFLQKMTWTTVVSESNEIVIKKALSNFLLLFEPLAVLFFMAILIGVNPKMMIPLAAILLVISYKHWQNYISRNMVLINGKLQKGVQIETGDVVGKVITLARSCVEIQTNKGVHSVSYQSILDQGYTISEGNMISRLYTLDMESNVENKKDIDIRLLDQLANIPYVDWSTTPDIEVSEFNPERISLRILLRDKSHLDEIISLLHEWRFTDITINNK